MLRLVFFYGCQIRAATGPLGPPMLRLGKLELPDVSIMGVLNVTPDSFSDGGRYNSVDAALRQAEKMLEEGASIIDVGGESTRPGSQAVADRDELERVVPIVTAIVERLDAVVSVDTTKAIVMRAAVDAGASMINDVRALQDEGALEAVAAMDCAVCLMHMQGVPRTMQENPEYDDVVGEVAGFLDERVAACTAAGIERQRICLDPGFGFGKSLEHNLTLLARLRELASSGLPLLAGISRKSMLGQVTGRAVDERMPGSIVAAAIAVQNGAAIVRVHDVGETHDAIRLVRAVNEAG